jgi:hypothetical protein
MKDAPTNAINEDSQKELMEPPEAKTKRIKMDDKEVDATKEEMKNGGSGVPQYFPEPTAMLSSHDQLVERPKEKAGPYASKTAMVVPDSAVNSRDHFTTEKITNSKFFGQKSWEQASSPFDEKRPKLHIRFCKRRRGGGREG